MLAEASPDDKSTLRLVWSMMCNGASTGPASPAIAATSSGPTSLAIAATSSGPASPAIAAAIVVKKDWNHTDNSLFVLAHHFLI